MEGRCLCSSITVKVHDSELFSGHPRGHLCHCRNCRRVAGGIFGTNLAIEADKVEIIGKENMKEYMDKDTTSGIPMARCFCMNCGTSVLLCSLLRYRLTDMFIVQPDYVSDAYPARESSSEAGCL